MWLAFGYGMAFSLAIETAQYFLPSRSPSASDVLMNALGSGLGAVLAASAVHPWLGHPTKKAFLRTRTDSAR